MDITISESQGIIFVSVLYLLHYSSSNFTFTHRRLLLNAVELIIKFYISKQVIRHSVR